MVCVVEPYQEPLDALKKLKMQIQNTAKPAEPYQDPVDLMKTSALYATLEELPADVIKTGQSDTAQRQPSHLHLTSLPAIPAPVLYATLEELPAETPAQYATVELPADVMKTPALYATLEESNQDPVDSTKPLAQYATLEEPHKNPLRPLAQHRDI